MAEYNPSSLWDVLDDYPDANRSRSVDLYLASQSHEHQERLAAGLDYLVDHSTPSFEEAGLADMGGGIIISYQEAPNIVHALTQYGLQRGQPNIRIVGYLNWPETLDSRAAKDTRNLLDNFIARNPHVPFAYFEDEEPTPLCIGEVRKMPEDILQPLTSDTALHFSHDADMRSMTPTHLADLYRNYRERNLPAVIPHTHNEQLPNHPNINRVMSWIDDRELREMRDNFFEPGPAFSAKAYREVGGYSHAYLGETSKLVRKIAAEYGLRAPADIRVPEAGLALSPRRFVAKFLASKALEHLWDGPEDFSASEKYRDLTHDDLQTVPDIPPEQVAEYLREFGPEVLRQIAQKNEFIEDGTAERIDLIFQLEAIKDRLGAPDDMFDFDNWRY